MNFKKSENTYRENAIVQREMAQKLISLTLNEGKSYPRILEIGSGTGFLTDEIVEKLKYGELFLNDIEKNQTGQPCTRYLKGDVQTVDLPKNIDLIISNAAFQWIEDLEKLLKKLESVANKGALLAFSTFGKRNFEQLKHITKGSLNYLDIKEVEALLENLEVLYIEEELKTLYFETPAQILRHIKATGVGRYQGGLWTKSHLEAFEKEYETLFKDSNGVELTYHPVYTIARFCGHSSHEPTSSVTLAALP